jgi:tetratricopeptide (TPR) repeat protein
MLVLHGQGGIGKTSLAVKLMAACGVDRSSSILPAPPTCLYDNALYCEVNDADSFDSLVAKFLTAFGMTADRQGATPAQIIERILTRLQQQRWLVVIDNLESLMEPDSSKSKSPDVGNLLNCLAYGGHNSQIIITSRKLPDDLRDRRGTKIDFSVVRAENIKCILDADSIQLLKNLGAKDTQRDLEWIAEQVRGNIFVLKLLADYSRKQPGILRNKPKLVTKEAKPIVRAQWELQSAPAQDLLQRMCVLRIGMDAEALTTLRLMQPHGKEMESTPEAEEVTEELLVGLVNCGLVEESYDNADCENLYVLHRLMAETLQAIFEEDLKCLWQYAASLYGAINRPPEYRSFEDLQFLLEEAHYYWLLGTSTNYLISILIDRVLPCLNNWCYWDLEELWLNRLLKVYAELDNRQVKMASFRGLLGDIARKRGDYDKAETLYDQSLAVYTEFGDQAEMAYCWSGLGYIARKLGDYYKAEALYKQSLAVHTEFADRARMASCWTSLGYIASKRGDYDRAETLYNQSLAVYNESGDQAGIAISWGLLGDTALKRDDYGRAEALYEQSLAVRTKLGDRARMATCWGGLGDIARKLGDYERAEALYKQSLAVRTKLGDRAGMATSWGCLGENEFVRGNLEAAKTWLKKALPVFEELQVPDSLAELNWDLAQLYRAKGNEQIAQEHYATSYALYTKLGAKGELERIEKEWL